MREELVHFVWKYLMFDLRGLQTTDNESVELIDPGRHNFNAGPDFLNARIRIDGTEWAGNVEIHVTNKEWYSHKHQLDPAYNSVILHVSMDDASREIITQNGCSVPCISLLGRVFDSVLFNYQKLALSKGWIPCHGMLASVDKLIVLSAMDNLAVERLYCKSTVIEQELIKNKYDWEEVFYQQLCSFFGLKVNKAPFLQLGLQTPLHILRKKRTRSAIEAILFGQSGFLMSRSADSYSRSLLKEYGHYRSLYNLKPVPVNLWKFHRLRPANFPTLRIAQLSALLYKTDPMFSMVLSAETINELKRQLSADPSPYWNSHYHFNSESSFTPKKLSDSFYDLFIINLVVPFLYTYGNYKSEQKYINRAMTFLEELPAEENKIIRKWKEEGIGPVNALMSQALLQLKNEHCVKFNCIKCVFGKKVLEP